MAPTARDLVRILLEIRYSWIPGPRTWTGSLVSRSAKRGESPTRKIECKRCAGEGKHGRAPCALCGGTGYLIVDAYTGRTANAPAERAADTVEVRREHARKVDAEIRRLIHERAVREGAEATGDLLTHATEAKERLYRQGSFTELDECCERLRQEWPRIAYAVELVYGPDALGEFRVPIRASVLAAADHGIALLAEWMPSSITVPRWALSKTSPATLPGTGRWADPSKQRERDELIWKLRHVEQRTTTEIASRIGLSRRSVCDILQKIEGRAA